MKRILYSQTTSILNEYFTNVCKKYKTSTLQNLDDMKKRILQDKSIPNYNDYIKYIDTIITHYDSIIKLKQKDFFKYHLFFPSIDLSTSQWFKSKRKNDTYKGSFYKNILNAMNYANIRNKYYAKAIKKLGIRTCVYCNAEYIPIIEQTGLSHRCHFEADHFFPKDEFPFLCISFYNLIPSCSFCNRDKSDNKSLFYLYTDNKNNLSPFSFHLDNRSIAIYKLFHNYDDLDIKFNVNNPKDKKILTNHEERFHITEIYRAFKDEAEEILWKAETINASYASQLKKSFITVFGNLGENEIRYLYGFYDKEEDIHKRPLTKMKQDIAKQLGILK